MLTGNRDVVRSHSQFENWRENICRQLIGVELQGNPKTFDGRFDRRMIGDACIADVTARDIQVYRRDTMLTSEGAADILVNLVLAGQARSAQAGNICSLSPGDVFIQSGALPYSLEFAPGSFRIVTLRVSKARFNRHATETEMLCSIPLREAGNAGMLAASLLANLHDNLDGLGDEDADLAIGLTLTLIASACARLRPQARSNAVATYERVTRFIDQRLTDPDLRPATVAAGVGLTPRQLSRLFEVRRQTVSQVILQRRLERCRLDLLSHGLSDRTIGEIAYSWGFNNLSHFSESFRKTYGRSARDLRKRRSAGSKTLM